MNGLDQEIKAAAAWLQEQALKTQYGEAAIKVVIHDGRLVRTERTVTAKTQPGNASENGRTAS